MGGAGDHWGSDAAARNSLPVTMLSKIIISDDLIVQIGSHALACLPMESCGLIAGIEERATAFLPVANELESPTAFRMNPQEQLNAFLWMESQNLDLLAVFHSHPNGPQSPSSTDISEFFYPEAASLIWTPASLRAFHITREGYVEIPVASDPISNG